MGEYGQLPATGVGAITLGGLAFMWPWVTVIVAVAIIGGLLLLRYVKPARIR